MHISIFYIKYDKLMWQNATLIVKKLQVVPSLFSLASGPDSRASTVSEKLGADKLVPIVPSPSSFPTDDPKGPSALHQNFSREKREKLYQKCQKTCAKFINLSVHLRIVFICLIEYHF